MSRIRAISDVGWRDPLPPAIADTSAESLERGEVLFFPGLAFPISADDHEIFSPGILSSSKNASFDPATGRVGGTTLEGQPQQRLRAVMSRFSDAAAAFVTRLSPTYGPHVVRARASFRPAEIQGRQSSWRKDDTRLHVDSFPASPVQGQRILRLFCNVNPEGRARVWRVGGDFTEVARRFEPSLKLPWPGSAPLLRLLRITKSSRTAYDALMLQLHDRMKDDQTFQESSEQERFEFPAASTWLAFTDQVPHAAMSGQYQLEQTFVLPIDSMQDPSRSPLRVLERLKGQRLA